jgi:putative FmdB family regulatory protein
MPIFEYACRSCGHTFEQFLVGADAGGPAALACPACQGRDLDRLISLFAVDSAATRQTHLNDGRKRVQRERRDKAHAELEEIHHHRE